jgi:Recombinase
LSDCTNANTFQRGRQPPTCENKAEQAAIRMMPKQRAGGLTLRQIVGALNQAFVPTKQNGAWQANTVTGILARA